MLVALAGGVLYVMDTGAFPGLAMLMTFSYSRLLPDQTLRAARPVRIADVRDRRADAVRVRGARRANRGSACRRGSRGGGGCCWPAAAS